MFANKNQKPVVSIKIMKEHKFVRPRSRIIINIRQKYSKVECLIYSDCLTAHIKLVSITSNSLVKLMYRLFITRHFSGIHIRSMFLCASEVGTSLCVC